MVHRIHSGFLLLFISLACLNNGVCQNNIQRPDLFDSLVSSGASFDMDSPVEARAEFDPPVVGQGGRVTYRVEVTALDESLTIPEKLPVPEGIVFHAGGRAQAYQHTINGKLRPQTTVIFHATATNNGTFIIPAFEVMAYGKPIKVPEAALTVLPKQEGLNEEPERLLVKLPEGEVYVGQLVKVFLALPQKTPGLMMGLSQPHVTGDFIFEEKGGTVLRQEAVRHNGQIINVLINEVSITPLRAGAQELVAQAYTQAMGASASNPNIHTLVNRLVDSEPVILNVKPLPTNGVPHSFTGAVGVFQVGNVSVNPVELHVGDPLTVRAEIVGAGNLARLIPPELPPLNNWQSFPPITDANSANPNPQPGIAVFNYTLIPMSDRIIATPGIGFSYFDPVAASYKELVIPPVRILVRPSMVPQVAAPVLPLGAAPLVDERTNEGPRLTLSPLAESPGTRSSTLVPLQARPVFWLAQLVPALILGALWGWRTRVDYLARHPEIIRNRIARRGIRREMKFARRAATVRDAAAFATRSANALREASAPYTASNAGALVCGDVLTAVDASPGAVGRGEVIRKVFAAADASRFGGQLANAEELLRLQPSVEEILNEMRLRL